MCSTSCRHALCLLVRHACRPGDNSSLDTTLEATLCHTLETLAALGAGPHPGLGRRGHGGGGDHEGTLIQDEQGALGGEEGEERRMITHS